MDGIADRIVLASGNPGKLREFEQLLAPLGTVLIAQGDLGVPEAPETGLSFVENAIIKARAAAEHAGLPAIADDSGLEVDWLGGAPGIRSARYAGGGDEANNARLLRELEGVPEQDRGARFHCVLVYLRHGADPTPLICQGSWEGRILTAPRGRGGFGYDPLFFVTQQKLSAAELPAGLKQRISHRGIAARKLYHALRDLQ